MAWGFSNNNHEQSVLHKIKYYSTAQNFEGRKFCGIHCFLSKQKNYFCEKEKTAAIHMAKIIYACNTQILFQQNFLKITAHKIFALYNRQHNYYIWGLGLTKKEKN